MIFIMVMKHMKVLIVLFLCYIIVPICRWLLEKKNVPSVVIGVKNLSQLEDNLGAVGWSLSKDDMEQLDKVSKVDEPYPYEMINRLNAFRAGKK